jgi:hypothetical protein
MLTSHEGDSCREHWNAGVCRCVFVGEVTFYRRSVHRAFNTRWRAAGAKGGDFAPFTFHAELKESEIRFLRGSPVP